MKSNTASLFQVLNEYRVKNIDHLQLKLEHIHNEIERLRDHAEVKHRIIGTSFLKQDLHCFALGHGPIVITMWSQMHGDESSASAAVLDFINVLLSSKQASETKLHSSSVLFQNWEDKFTIHIAPMLNPDGAKFSKRYNAQGLDINRDALALQTPEGNVLNALIEETKPQYAFNLHDQDPYYRCGAQAKPVTIAFLAPAYNPQKELNHARQNAMTLIAEISKSLQEELNGQIAKYDDTFSERSFGDQIAAKGISTILIESGYFVADETRQVARSANLVALVRSLSILAEQSALFDDKGEYSEPRVYADLPLNIENKWCDLLIKNLHFKEQHYSADVAIRKPTRYSNEWIIYDLGDLRDFAGEIEFDADQYVYEAGQSFLVDNKLVLDEESYLTILRDGYTHFVGEASLINNVCGLPIVNNPKIWHDDFKLSRGTVAAGFLVRNGIREFAIINGRLLKLS